MFESNFTSIHLVIKLNWYIEFIYVLNTIHNEL